MGGALLCENNETWFNERETTNAPIGALIDTTNPVGGFSNPWQGYPGGSPHPTNGRAYFPTSGGVYVNMPINPRSTHVTQWNATYQRQIKDWVVSASYLGNKTTYLWMAGEINPAIYIPGASTTSNTQARRRLTALNSTYGPSYASINTMDDGAVAHYQALLLSLKHSFGHGFTLLTNYTDSYCVSDQDFGAALASSSNSFPFSGGIDRGPCNFDTRHIFNTSLVATSTVKSSRWASRLLSDWKLAPLFHAASGQPLTITSGIDNSLTGFNNDRPVRCSPL